MTNHRALAFIFCTVTLDVLALGIVVQVLPRILLEFAGGDTARATELLVLFATVWGGMQFVFSPFMGVLSDRFGRRPVILISCLGLSLDHIFMALAPTLDLLLVGRIVSGITSSTVSTARAYVADVTTPEQRGKAFGVIGMSFGIGFILGPALGGFLGEIDPRLPFWAAAAATLANAFFGWYVLPESVPPDRRTPFSWKRANPVGAMKFLAVHRELSAFAGVHFLLTLSQQVLPAVFVLYTTHRYGWDDRMIGLTLVTLGVCSALVQGFLIGPIIDWLGPRRTLLYGLILGIMGFVVYAVAPSGPWFWLGLPAMALWSMSSPALQAIMTNRVDRAAQGQLQGAMACLRALSGIVGPSIFGGLFAWSVDPLPGASFLLAMLLLVAAALTVWVVTAPPPPAGQHR